MISEIYKLPSGWKWVKLGDVCDVTKLAGFEYTEHVTYCSNGDYIALRAQNVRNDGLDLQNKVYISKDTASFLSRSKLSFGDVVMTFIGANIGESTWIDKNDTYYCAPNIAKIKPNQRLLFHRFLTRVIHSPIIRQQIEELNKSTAQQSLSMQNIREFFIPIPPLEEQKRIAAILEKCDRLRRTRRYSLQLSETFLQSVFLEMFGDPVTNPMGWDKYKIADLCRIRRGASPRPIEDYLGGTVPWIKIGDGAKGDGLYLHSTKDFVTVEGAKKSVFLEKGSLIFANCGVSLGFARILKIDGCIHDGWLSFDNLDNSLNQIFFLRLLNQLTLYFRGLAPDGTQPNLNTQIMGNFLMI